MTTTQEALIIDEGNKSPSEEAIEVEIWGPPGNGKSVLLVSMMETLREQGLFLDFDASASLLELRDRLLRGEQPGITTPQGELDQLKKEGEYVVFNMPTRADGYRRVRVVSNAGEDLLRRDGSIKVPEFVKEREGKVFVACLNPFKIDPEMASKALKHLIAVHQSRGMVLEEAFNCAAWTLFQISAVDLHKYNPMLAALLTFWKDTKILYDPGQTDSKKRFQWECIDTGGMEQLSKEMDKLINGTIRAKGVLVDVLIQALRKIENAVVVLTHVDLIDDVLTSITFSDLERVYSKLFKDRPERMVSQQAVARLFNISLASPSMTAMSSATSEQVPSAGSSATSRYVVMGLTQELRGDGAVQLVEYIKSLASRGVEPAVVQVTRLRQQIDKINDEYQSVLKKQLDVANQLQTTKVQLEAERVNRVRLEGDATRLATEKEAKASELEHALRDASQSAARSAEVAADLAQSRLKLSEASSNIETLQRALDEEKRRHEETKTSADRALAGSATLERVGELEKKLTAAERERDSYAFKIAELENNTADSQRVAKLDAELKQIRAALAAKEEEIRKSQAKIDELKKSPSTSLGELQRAYEMIDEQRGTIQKLVVQVASLEKSNKEWMAGRISPDEARQRDSYERGRLGILKLWSLFLVRALPVLPFVAGLWVLASVAPSSPQNVYRHAFIVDSGIAVGVTCFAALVSVALQAVQLPTRWIWLRSMSMTTPRTLEALTSGGEKLTSAPGNFTLERSPLLALLGLAMIRRNDSGQRYVTTEPGTWLAAPERPQVRWIIMLDVITVFLLVIWVVLIFTL